MKIALIGASGLVGQEVLRLLETRNFPFQSLVPVASLKSVGKMVQCKGQSYDIINMEDAIRLKPEIAIFSAGGGTSLEWAPKFAEIGTVVIDNSSTWRMDPTKKLVVPEVNGHVLTSKDKIIANLIARPSKWYCLYFIYIKIIELDVLWSVPTNP